jgi:anti-anti-sigma factor
MAPIERLSVTVSHRRLSRLPRRDTALVVVRLRGEHDLSTVAVVSETMAWAIDQDDADVVVDLSDVQFMGAITVGVLIRARGLLRTRSRSLMVRSPSRCARRVLELCGATDLFDPADAAPLAGTAGARATWVTVPGAERVDRHAHASPPKSTNGPDPISIGQVTATRLSAVETAHRLDEHAADLAGSEAP